MNIKAIFDKAKDINTTFRGDTTEITRIDIIIRMLDVLTDKFCELRERSNAIDFDTVSQEDIAEVGKLFQHIMLCALISIQQSAVYLADIKAFNCNTVEDIYSYAANLYTQKNQDYGDSSDKTFQLFGGVSYVVRLSDKKNRLENLSTNDKQRNVKDESINDTILDILNYSAMYFGAEEAEIDIKNVDIILNDLDNKTAIS